MYKLFLAILVTLTLFPSFFKHRSFTFSSFITVLLQPFTIISLFNWNFVAGFIVSVLNVLVGAIAFSYDNSDSDYDSGGWSIQDFMLLVIDLTLGIGWLLLNGVPSLVNFVIAKGMSQQDDVFSSFSSSGINLDSIKASLTEITDSLRRVSDNIENEGSSLEISVAALLEQVQAKESELQALNEQSQSMITEIDRYRALTSLTKEQAEVIRLSLNQGKNLERLTSFILGVASGFLGRFIAGYVDSMFRKNEHEETNN